MIVPPGPAPGPPDTARGPTTAPPHPARAVPASTRGSAKGGRLGERQPHLEPGVARLRDHPEVAAVPLGDTR